MPATQILYGDAGIPAFYSEQFTDVELFAGSSPDVTTDMFVTTDSLVATVGLPAFSVCGIVNGTLVMATAGTGAIQAVCITTAPVAAGTVGGRVGGFITGCFNPDALTWDPSFTTDALKKHAFDGSARDIVLKKPLYSGVY